MGIAPSSVQNESPKKIFFLYSLFRSLSYLISLLCSHDDRHLPFLNHFPLSNPSPSPIPKSKIDYTFAAISDYAFTDRNGDMNSRRRPRVYAQPISNNTQSPHSSCVELKSEVLGPIRSLKRKKSSSSVVVPGPSAPKGKNYDVQRAENRVPASTSKPSVSRYPSTRPPSVGSDFSVRVSSKKEKGTEETSKHPRDTRRHSNVDEAISQHSNMVGRHFFTGPLAVAEHERMKKEIENLKETLHESRQICRLQAEVF